MVSLSERTSYLEQFGGDTYLDAFVNFLRGQEIAVNNGSTSAHADELMLRILKDIQLSNKDGFCTAYGELSRRRPRADSDWVYNDLLLFSLTLGVSQFQSSSDWLRQTLEFRLNNGSSEKRIVARTFLDLLNGNLESTSNYQPLMIVMKHLSKQPLGELNYVNSVYESLVNSSFPTDDAPFLNIIRLKALDVIVTSKNLANFERNQAVETFIQKFTKRSRQAAQLLWWIILICTVVATLRFCLWYFTTDPANQEFVNGLVVLLPIVGFGGFISLVLANKQKMINVFQRWIFDFYGYRLSEDGGQ